FVRKYSKSCMPIGIFLKASIILLFFCLCKALHFISHDQLFGGKKISSIPLKTYSLPSKPTPPCGIGLIFVV
ncbi:MAG: hypothetical protein LBN06_00760, partial [Prevotellaceae bacterium]|nr:hypothetical protein [Prevotellaceae bacterium]